ncbi:MAG: tetratricopeptide repeat protein [FCB group bacterium]|nr:tetratricopeptide repeat protein [FCB group bacterium]
MLPDTHLLAAGKISAGRNYQINDFIEPQLWDSLRSHFDLPLSEWEVGLCLFTNDTQRFSDKLLEDFSTFYTAEIRRRVPAVEIRFFSDSSSFVVDDTNEWQVIRDTDHWFYEQFGLRVYPTVYIISNEGIIQNYFPGYSPSTMYDIKKALSLTVKGLIEEHQVTEYNKNTKHNNRNEKLAVMLFRKKQFQLAALQLQNVDSLSEYGRVLQGLLQIKLKNYDRAEAILKPLVDSPEISDEARFALGVVAVLTESPDSAISYFNQVRLPAKKYLIHYWKGRAYEAADKPDLAKKEYRKSMESKLHGNYIDILPEGESQ